MFNERKFRAKMIEKNYSMADVAKMLGINEATLYRKTSGKSDFSRNELSIIKAMLSLTVDEFEGIFFDKELA